MKRLGRYGFSLLFVALIGLAPVASATPTDGGQLFRPFSRIVKTIKHLFASLVAEDGDLTPPKP